MQRGQLGFIPPAQPNAKDRERYRGFILYEAQRVIEEAKRLGIVLTIHTEPQQPLAMRNYRMVAEVRDARE